MDEQELLEKAKNLLDRHGVLLAEPRPGRTITDTPEIFMIMDPGKPVAVFNQVIHANFEADEAEDRISEVFEMFRSRGLPFRWAVNSLSSPNDLGERLLARNPVNVTESIGYAIPCCRMPQLPAPHVTVEELNKENLQDYILAATDSFAEISESAVESLKVLARDEVAKPNPTALSFLARYKGLPAGFGRLRILRENGLVAGYIGGGGVRPRFRHRPVVRMICLLARELQRRGIELLLAHGNVKTSAGILKKLGFRAYGEQRYYTFSK